jgi:hypothetical protein
MLGCGEMPVAVMRLVPALKRETASHPETRQRVFFQSEKLLLSSLLLNT